MPRRRQTNTRPAPPNGNPNGGGSSGHHHNQNENHHHHHHSHHHRPRHHQHHHNNNNYNNGNNNYQQQQNNAFPQQQQHEYYQQSDHDAVAASAVLAYRNDTRSSLNLPVIRRHIPTAKRVVAMAAYVTVYKISATSGQWDKPDIEGPLFILEVDIDPNDNENEDEGNGNGDGDGDGGGGGDGSSSNGNGNGRRKWKKLTTRYQIFVMNRKGICSLLIPLPRKVENLDTGNSELISILVDEASTTSKNKRNSMENDGGTGDNHKRSTSKNRNSSGGGDGKMKFNESDEKGKSVECYGLRIYSEEGTSTEGDRQRIGEELIALVAELKEEELLAARLAEEAKAEMERQRIMEEEMAAAAAAQQMAMMEMQQQQQQQPQQQHHHHHHHHHAAAVGMARSQSTFRDMGGSYRENMSSGRRITLAELFGQNSAGIGGVGGGGGLDPMSGFRDGEYEEVPGPVPMGFSYTHM